MSSKYMRHELADIMAWLVDHIERETCIHEEVERGGAIWTTCTQCKRQWADDEGGFVPYKEPAQMDVARGLIDWLRTSAPNDTSNLVTLVALQRELAALRKNPPQDSGRLCDDRHNNVA